MRARLLAATLGITAACSRSAPDAAGESPYLLISAGSQDTSASDFLAVVDVRPGSPTLGKVVATTPTGMRSSIPHHMEYTLPPAGELLFMNAHHHEMSLLVDVADPTAPRIVKTFEPPPPFRFPHDYTRTPSGTRLVGFLRSEGQSIDPTETATPGNFGGIAEYSAEGELLRTAHAGNAGTEPVRPYAFALLPDIDRLVVTSAPMMEDTWADVVQVYRYSDFALLRTIDLSPGRGMDGAIVEGSQRAGFGPRVLPDGSVFFNTYGCAFYRLSEIASETPKLETFFALSTPPQRPGSIRGSCGIPVVYGHYWINPVGQLHAVVVLDIANPSSPKEVFRLATPDTFNPHWLSRDPASNRLVLGAELGGEEGFYILRFDDSTGRLSFDEGLHGEGHAGYVSLKEQAWPNGASGPAWGHAALFLPAQRALTPQVTVLSISGHSLQAPDTINAGWTTFRFANDGDDIHYAHIVRLDSARTVSELLAAYAEAIRTSGPRPAWVKRFGGPGGAAPGDTSVVTQYLEAGDYVWICPVEDEGGHPHFGMGEFKPFVVRANDAAAQTAAPVATRVIHLQDYGFTIDVPLSAGRQRIRVVNDGPEPHDINLMKLMPGKSVDDVRTWLNPERARRTDPGRQSEETATTLVTGVGGVAALKPGMEAYFEADLAPGDYVLACMVTAPDGRSHIEHGMLRAITIPRTPP